MDTDRPPHRCTSNSSSSGGGSTTSELFICFTSRLSSSSSMKISSKSILSPGRARDSSQISLSTSLSRRLRSSGSIKGGQASPMFPATNGKKRGCNSFENPEPSSPKVTCIGQVRVKTKKQGKKMRARSKSRREVSFRKTEQTGDANGNHFHQFQQQECLPHHRNQRWVHLPVTICEALRAFGAEFNCFLPCRSSCMASDNSNQRDKEERASNGGGSGTSTSCGAVFARWLVAEKIELVVGEAAEEREKEEDDDDDDDIMPRRSQRRHVFEDIVIEEAEKCVSKNEILEADEKEDEARVSICVPPKNALLLMRCRSDPVKMAALANRFWECPPPPDEADEENEENNNENGVLVEQESHQAQAMEQRTEDVFCEKLDSFAQILVLEEETVQSASSPEAFTDPENEVNAAKSLPENEDVLENEPEPAPKQENELTFDEESEENEQEREAIVVEESTEVTTEKILHEEEDEETVMTTHERSEPEELETTQEPETGHRSKERESQNLLPDCLLLMMCEPKLSMEVSKETWVCSTDFIRWNPSEKKPPPPQQIVNKTNGCDQPKKRVSIDLHPAPQQQIMQPPRSSCSFPAAPPPLAQSHGALSMNTMVEQKLVGGKQSYEPFMLTRCKSEPLRSSAKLAPEACFWKNRKLEPHRPTAALGVGGF
ncbi:hypothetical protein JRO89_XS15G0101700 [Xanthoceras sorbifolium]|uniref:Uncharacterized protein n=1 Tax=Xanthoceras sorbifolium TaxID=99658 RepID=A0ABQ8H1J7_9ROSI|nr:hypothetical protein JRO89_XS15G0101700 [Xanthoceras sorbifolium]